MENVKNWLKSKTILALIALLIPVISKMTGLDIGGYIATITGLINSGASVSEWIDFLLILIPAVIAAISRIKAKDKLTMSFKK